VLRAAGVLAPCESAQDFVKGWQRADASSEITGSDKHFTNVVVELWVSKRMNHEFHANEAPASAR
jgi:hypothetical protein